MDDIPPNSHVSMLVHIPLGAGLFGGAALWSASKHEPAATAAPGATTREDVLRGAEALGGHVFDAVLITGGMQVALGLMNRQIDLPRGLGPVYHLAVGAGVAGMLALPKYREALEN